MLESCRVLAPAKINIGLNVLPGTVDGYHNIESVFQAVSLCDTLLVACAPEKGVCSVECTGMDLPPHNTITAAYAAFCEETGNDNGVRVVLTKHIPHGAGLGGGSSDAAFFVKALERLFAVPPDMDMRARVASRVGSDVFFFLLGGKKNLCAVVTGRGENIKRITARRLFFVLVCPDVYVSTKEAYDLLDSYYAEQCAGGECASGLCTAADETVRAQAFEAMYHADVRAWRFVNSFTEPVSSHAPQIAEALRDVREAGALFADMSGSGSSVFGVYLSYEEARKAHLQLERRWKRCYTLTSI
jgi:4-diphosphocytidyl-2-C-methyl-D-erythritol kinase